MEEMSLNVRVSWAINHVIKTRKQSNKKIGEATGFIYGTISNYRLMKTKPSAEFIANFVRIMVLMKYGL